MPDRDEVREIEVEVIPPGGKIPPPPSPPPMSTSARGETPPRENVAGNPTGIDDPFIAFVSKLMDTVFVIPGTGIRFGFDPLIGLIPGIGDTATGLTSLLLIAQSARYGLPRIVLARMVLNVLLNSGVGAIPVAGDLFSLWFRSNVKNYELFRKHAGTAGSSTKTDWFFVTMLIVGTLGFIAFVFLSALAWFQMLVRLLNGS
jgi:Domain of unknown function (DUF4112)